MTLLNFLYLLCTGRCTTTTDLTGDDSMAA
jgi:hypothetical protein